MFFVREDRLVGALLQISLQIPLVFQDGKRNQLSDSKAGRGQRTKSWMLYVGAQEVAADRIGGHNAAVVP